MEKLKKLFLGFRNTLIRVKVYFSRTTSYIGMINSTMILFLLLSNLEKYGIDLEIRNWLIPLIILGVVGMVIFGFLEDKLGFYQQEKRVVEAKSPNFASIHRRLDKLEEKIDKLKK